MKLFWLAACCTLLAFAAVNAAASACLVAHWRLRGHRWMGASSSSLLFRRWLPAALSAALSLMVVLPSFLRHEPRNRVESVGVLLAAGAIAGIAILVAAALRGVVALARTRAGLRRWLVSASPMPLHGWAGRAWLVESEATAACTAGLIQPELFLSRRVVETCTPGELAGIVAHERAHAAARHNLKRLLLLCTPDLVRLTPAARAIEHSWAARAEEEADGAAGGSDRAVRLDIAGAIVRLARLRAAPRLPVATMFDAGGPIERRIRLLLRHGTAPASNRSPSWMGLALAIAGLAAATSVPAVSVRVHHVVEAVVHALSL